VKAGSQRFPRLPALDQARIPIAGRKRDRTEAIRVSYVAAIRTRDFVVVPACGDEPVEGWLEHPILRRAASARNGSLRREAPVMLILKEGGLVAARQPMICAIGPFAWSAQAWT